VTKIILNSISYGIERLSARGTIPAARSAQISDTIVKQQSPFAQRHCERTRSDPANWSNDISTAAVSSLSPCGRGLGRGAHTGGLDVAPLPSPAHKGGGNGNSADASVVTRALLSQIQFSNSQTQLRARRRRARPELMPETLALRNRGRGECRVPNAPAAWCALGVVKYAHQYSQRRHRIHPAFPTQWFYGLYVISPVTSSFLPPSSQLIQWPRVPGWADKTSAKT
jgi:hypothetical protein